ncbi:hypothetical protein BDN72DRAFT_135286 [Pluteus cervinus]|uniref:Uncharacterized protein n=1 Tax=Pluteus cervinus TaxID=181527 RepID=A0ACD3B781_9AGAR|nr:hypothetical protein BDN72DRAFT_135286 [Pluteus cervinus]
MYTTSSTLLPVYLTQIRVIVTPECRAAVKPVWPLLPLPTTELLINRNHVNRCCLVLIPKSLRFCASFHPTVFNHNIALRNLSLNHALYQALDWHVTIIHVDLVYIGNVFNIFWLWISLSNTPQLCACLWSRQVGVGKVPLLYDTIFECLVFVPGMHSKSTECFSPE